MSRLWRGELVWDASVAAGDLVVHGSSQVRRAVPRWLGMSRRLTAFRPRAAATQQHAVAPR